MKPSNTSLNSEEPLVTIGIPVYNVELYIEKCLYSIMNQTYKNIEIIVVDDCGTDNSMQVVRQFQRNCQNGCSISIITQFQNGGSGEARNSVIQSARGKYLYFLDSDDYIEPNTIELLVGKAEEYGTDAVFASLRKVIYGTTDEMPTSQYSKFMLIKGKDEFAKYVCKDLRWHIAVTACNVLFLTAFLRNNNLLFLASKDEDALFLSDFYSDIECAVILPDVTYNYVMRPGSKMGNNYRNSIPVDEIRGRFYTDSIMTERCARLKDRSFYDAHCARVMKHKFRAVCVALRHRQRFTEPLVNREIMEEMKHPATLTEILKFRRYRLFNLSFYLIGILPSFLSTRILYVIGKLLKWI